MNLDLIGKRYGRLTVIKRLDSVNYRVRWLCKCDCGNEKIVKTIDLQRGATKSCGCLQKERRENQPSKYPKDLRINRLRHIWYGMIRRCTRQDYNFYHRYGGRGITVCDEWKEYIPFARWSLANGYADNLTLDRINFDGNYEPSNCRWIPEKEQHNNTSANIYLTMNGESKTITQWAKEYGIHRNTFDQRIKSGKSIEEALKTPEHRIKGNRGMPIKCVETGEEFTSGMAAAKKYGLNASSITAAARTGRLSYGKHWEYIY